MNVSFKLLYCWRSICSKDSNESGTNESGASKTFVNGLAGSN